MIIKRIAPTVLIFVLLATPFIVVPKFLLIKEIHCKSQYGPCRKEIEEKLNSLEGKSLQEVKKETKQLLDEEVLTNEYITKFQLPNIVSIELTEKKALYAIKNSGQEVYALVSDGGYVMGYSESTNLPFLEGDQIFYDEGEEVSDSHRFALNLILELFYLYSVSDGNIQDNSLVVYLNSGEKVVLPLEGDIETLVGSLQLVISNLKQDGKESRIDGADHSIEIDLRYKNPVIRKAK